MECRLLRMVGIAGFGAVLACGDGDALTRAAAQIAVSPNPIDFAPTALGLTSNRTIEISNESEVDLEIASLTIQDSDEVTAPAWDVEDRIAPNGKRALTLTFSPRDLLAASPKLLILSNAANAPELTIPIIVPKQTGSVLVVCVASQSSNTEGLGPIEEICTDTSTAVDLGTVPVGETRTGTITLKSVGDISVLIRSAAFDSGSDSAFGTSSPVTSVLPLLPGQTQRIPFRYQPSSAGEKVATFVVDTSQGPRTISFTARSTEFSPALCLDPPVLDFGNLPVGSSLTKKVRVRACGEEAIIVSGFEISGQRGSASTTTTGSNHTGFSLISAVAPPVSLSPGVAFDIDVSFSPTTQGQASAELRVVSDAGEAKVSLLGRSSDCELKILPTQIYFNLESNVRSFLITNTGSGDCYVRSIKLDPSSAPEFQFNDETPSLPLLLESGATILRDVLFNTGREAATEEKRGSIMVDFKDNTTERIERVDLIARLTPPPAPCLPEVIPSQVAFGVVRPGVTKTQSVRITNRGETACELEEVRLTPESSTTFTIQGLGGGNIAPGASIRKTVTFTANTFGTFRGEIRFELPQEGLSLRAALSASTDAALLCVDPMEVDFGVTTQGTATIQLTACSSLPAEVYDLRFDRVRPEFRLESAPATPFVIPSGQTLPITVTFTSTDTTDTIGKITQLIIDSNDTLERRQRVLLKAGPNTEEICENGIDEDGDGFIDEDCVEGPAVGRAVPLGEGRLFVWGDEHVTREEYGLTAAPFWRGVLGWLSCSNCPGTPKTQIATFGVGRFERTGDFLVAEVIANEVARAGLSFTGELSRSADAAQLQGIDIVIAVAGSIGPAWGPVLRDWVNEGGALMMMVVGGGAGECENGYLDVLAPFPLRFECPEQTPYGVSRFYPHPISFGLLPTDAPFQVGQLVIEDPGTHSTVIAVAGR